MHQTLIYICRPRYDMAISPSNAPASDIPNVAGFKLLALLDTGLEALLTVQKHPEGYFHLGIPITRVLGWQKARQEWIDAARAALAGKGGE